LEDAALPGLGAGYRRHRLAGDPGGDGVGGGRRETEERRGAEELAPADAVVAEIFHELGDVGVRVVPLPGGEGQRRGLSETHVATSFAERGRSRAVWRAEECWARAPRGGGILSI